MAKFLAKQRFLGSLFEKFFDMVIKSELIMSLLNYVPPAPSRLTCLRAFAPYAPLYLHALRAFAPYVPYSRALYARLTSAPCASFSRALCALFVYVKIVLGWIFIPAKSYHFPRIIKDTTNCAVFKRVKKKKNFFKRGNFLSIFKP